MFINIVSLIAVGKTTQHTHIYFCIQFAKLRQQQQKKKGI